MVFIVLYYYKESYYVDLWSLCGGRTKVATYACAGQGAHVQLILIELDPPTLIVKLPISARAYKSIMRPPAWHKESSEA